MKRLFTILFIVLLLVGCTNNTQEEVKDYQTLKDELLSADEYKSEFVLTEEEEKAELKLKKYREEYLSLFEYNDVYEMPVCENELAYTSDLYKLIQKMPKGSDLHIHGNAILPVEELIEYFTSRDEYYVGTGEDNYYVLSYHADKGDYENEINIKDGFESGLLTKDDLLNNWTLKGGQVEKDIWVHFEKLFDRHLALGSIDVCEDYYEWSFRHCAENNVMHLEVRILFFGNNEDAYNTALKIRNAYYKVKNDYPAFVASIIGTGLKYAHLKEYDEMLINNSLYVYENVKDDYDPNNIHNFLIGIDFVNEEDKSQPLIDFKDQIDYVKENYPELMITLHAGETLDPNRNNLVDAYLLNSKRIGHGLSLYRYPNLLEKIKEKDICVEVCLSSNLTLRYIKDLRSHPIVEYLKRGISVVLASDDPSYQEHAVLSDDFFEAVVAYDLGLKELKQLCKNSIVYSGLDESQKNKLLEDWEIAWDEFIKDVNK